MIRRLLSVVTMAALFAAAVGAEAGAERTPTGVEYHPLTFPVQEKVSYWDDFMGPRDHHGNDLMGAKLMHLRAASDGTVTWVRAEHWRNSGNMLILTGNDGWIYWYLHINNDTPGTDDNANPAQWMFAPGIKAGSKVTKGQFIAYMGDSGEAEPTQPHLHFELHRPDDSFIDPYTSLRLAQGAGANGLCRYPTNPPSTPRTSAGRGFWTLGRDGKVLKFGSLQTYGRPPAPPTGVQYVAITSSRTGNGYLVVDSRGAVTAFGDAKAFGGMEKFRLNAPILGITRTPTGNGYWLLARDGGIFSFGDAKFWGSTGAMKLNAPVISMAATPGGNGYWLLASDGGIFSYGDAKFWGSTGGRLLKYPIVAMASTHTGGGYWLLTQDGYQYNFGDAVNYGSVYNRGWCPGPTALMLARTNASKGYWVLLSDGQVVPFGDAYQYGGPNSYRTTAVSLAAAP